MSLLDKLVNPGKIIDEKALVEAAIVGLRELLQEGLTIRAEVGGVSVVAEISARKQSEENERNRVLRGRLEQRQGQPWLDPDGQNETAEALEKLKGG